MRDGVERPGAIVANWGWGKSGPTPGCGHIPRRLRNPNPGDRLNSRSLKISSRQNCTAACGRRRGGAAGGGAGEKIDDRGERVIPRPHSERNKLGVY